jgi:chromosome partitioning protein
MLACMSAIIAVGASKGGTGKTTLSYELASALGAILIDLDWDGGSASRMWGLNPTLSRSAPLLDALERGPGGRPPTVRRRPHQPALVPSHPDLSSSNVDDGLVADCLESWTASWDVPFVVVDTHPGANVLTDGALASCDLLVIPVVLGQRELDALETMVADFARYRLLLVPNMVPAIPPRRQLERLRRMAGDLPVGPPISEHRWLRRRIRRSATTLQPNPGARVRRAAAEFMAVAASVREQLSVRPA